jgi:hypothetical protein
MKWPSNRSLFAGQRKSAKGAVPRRHEVLQELSAAVARTPPVLRVFLKRSAAPLSGLAHSIANAPGVAGRTGVPVTALVIVAARGWRGCISVCGTVGVGRSEAEG